MLYGLGNTVNPSLAKRIWRRPLRARAPGPQNIREELYRKVTRRSDVFTESKSKLTSKKWSIIYRKSILRKIDYKDRTEDELKELIKSKFVSIEKEVRKITKVLADELAK